MKRRFLLTSAVLAPLAAHRCFSNPSLMSGWDASGNHGLATGSHGGPMAELSNDGFLTDLQQRCYHYFERAADPVTGLVSDRGRRDGSAFSAHASSAACGFALSAHGIAAESGWLDRNEAKRRVARLLTSMLETAQHERGLVYHFVDKRTGHRMPGSEASVIDTALLIAGAMHAAQVFAEDGAIGEKADRLYRRVDWAWMLGENGCLHMGWKPETGRINHQWDRYSESILAILMAIGAPENAIPAESWQKWKRHRQLHYRGEPFLSYPPLFVHQYPAAFFDFRSWRSPSGRDYFRNSVVAHHAQIDFMKRLAEKVPERFGHYGDNLWGLTSSDSQHGYRDWGGPYRDGETKPERGIDGTVVPSAAGGALAIVPERAMHTLRHQLTTYGDAIYGPFGFVNAFNPANGWIGRDVIGIDTGITLLMAANRVDESVWQPFMRHPSAQLALQRAGFRPLAT